MTQPDPAEPNEITHSPLTAGAIGFVAGMFSVLFGVGGGLLMVPGMAYFLRIRQHRAVGTSLAAILPTALVGVLTYRESSQVKDFFDWTVVFQLAVGGVLGALLGAAIANAIAAKPLRRAFGVFVVLVGMLMIYTAARETGSTIQPHEYPWPVMVCIGVVVGVVSGLMGVGGGVVMVPVLALALGYSQKLAQAVSLAVIVPVSLSAACGHYRRKNIIPSLALWLAIGAGLGAVIVGNSVHKITDPVLRGLFGVLLITFGVSIVSSRTRSSGVQPPNVR